jgi:hypothetical protein
MKTWSEVSLISGLNLIVGTVTDIDEFGTRGSIVVERLW